MLTSSLYTNIAFFILFQHYFSVLSNEVSVIQNATDDVFGHASQFGDAAHDDDPGVSEIDGIHQQMPVFPERRDAVYFVVAVAGGAKTWGRLLAKTLLDLGPPFNNPQGPPLRPIYVDMPQNGRFSSKVLTVFCQQTENRPLAGVIVIGEGQSARAVALAGTAMKLPVLWAKGGTASLNGKHKEIETPLQALLQPSAKEILEAVRAIFLQTHWHSFFVMSDMESSMILKSSEGSSIRVPPLVPTILPLPARNGNIFKQLAEISKSTRGVVLLLCNLETARKIMSEAQRLHMVGGHFIWLWADTSSTTEFYDTASQSMLSATGPLVVNRPPSSSQANLMYRQGAREKSRASGGGGGSSSAAAAITGRQGGGGGGGGQNPNGYTNNSGRRAGQKGQQQQQQRGGRKQDAGRANESNDSRRERFPSSGRSRPVSAQNDKSRNRRDFANPTEPPDESSSSPSLHNGQLVEHIYNNGGDGDGGDNDYYEDEHDIDGATSNESYDSGDGSVGEQEQREAADEEDESEATEDADSERRILELLAKTGTSYSAAANDGGREESTNGNTKESIRLAGKETLLVDDKWVAGNLTSASATSPSAAAAADIDPIIKYGEELDGAAKTQRAEDPEEVSKLKRTPNFSNMNNSDVLFHHFKDFPIGLLALRPVRMHVDRHFIKATVQLFANTWKRIEDTPSARVNVDQPRGWQFDGERWRRRRRRKKRSDGDESQVNEDEDDVGSGILSYSDKLGVMDSDNVTGGEGWGVDNDNAASRGFPLHGDEGGANEHDKDDGRAGRLPTSSSAATDTVLFNGANNNFEQSVVNTNNMNQLNQSFNASDLGHRRVNYRRLSDHKDSSYNTSDVTNPSTTATIKATSTPTSTSSAPQSVPGGAVIANKMGISANYGANWGAENATNERKIGTNSTENLIAVDSMRNDRAEGPSTQDAMMSSASDAAPIIIGSSVGGLARAGGGDKRDESGLKADNIITSSDSGSYFKSQHIVSLKAEPAQYSAELGDHSAGDNVGGGAGGGAPLREQSDGMSDSNTSESNTIKSKRKTGTSVSDQQERNRVRSGSTSRQQILGSWAKSGSANIANNNSAGRRLGSPQYGGGCYGTPTRNDARRAESFARLLRQNTQSVLEGVRLSDGPIEKSLITQFELLNLVPLGVKSSRQQQQQQRMKSAFSQHPARRDYQAAAAASGSLGGSPGGIPMTGNGGNKYGLTKWRRVGLITGSNVHLDTIVWPGGDIVVSGLSARPRSVFRVVTALAPPFVMESDLDEDGLCLRGLPCHRLLPTGHNNLTQIFNAIETRSRLEQDAIEHGWEVPDSEEDVNNPSYKTKCCYGLSMDLLENVATELGFQFHLYLVRDEKYGAKYTAMTDAQLHNLQSSGGEASASSLSAIKDGGDEDGRDETITSGGRRAKETGDTMVDIDPDWDQSNADAADKKYFMNADRIFGQKNQHVFYKLDRDGKRTQFNRDFGYMEERLDKEQAINARRQKLRNGEVQVKWNGIIGDLISGSADMSFSALSVSKARAEAIDFSAPYFHSGVSLLAAPQTKSEIPLLAFLLPFSPELWIAIFTSLNITAVAVAVYEWLSPFGLNPWGRQRNKNFSMSSALWVMWGLLCGHLVAFKAPKSWPNKFLINVWGGFSVIFVASYTANIAALIAGLFFHNAANKYDASLFTQRVGAPKASAAEQYLQKNDRHLWEHMKKYSLHSLDEGITRLKNKTLDLMMADSPILDYYRATDPGCNLKRIGETYVEDAYAIGMTKGFPLKDSISELIAKYSSNGYLDILTEKWYGGLPCFKLDTEIVQPRPLGVAAVAGVFLLLGMGMILGVLILIFEHWFYKYTLPKLRHKPQGTVWKSPNIMFFSQKLYRFINCVELVSPHHAARELVHTLRQGQIASLFQKSIKRKEDEQRRRRKSKAQFFEMIQEIRRINFLSRLQQQHEREAPIQEVEHSLELNAILSPDKLSGSQKVSPKPKGFRKDSRSRSNSSGLNVRRFSTDSILAERLDTIGRRLSRDVTNSPPDLGHRLSDALDGIPLSKTARHGNSASAEMLTDSNKFDTISGSLQPPVPGGSSTSARKFNSKRSLMHLDVKYDRERERKKSADNIDIMPTLKERLAPPICLIEPNKAELRNKLHAELKSKYGPTQTLGHQSQQPPQQFVAKPPRRGPLPLPPPGDIDGGAGSRNVPIGVELVKPKIKVTVRPDSLSCGNTGPMVVGMTPKSNVRPVPSPRHVTIAAASSSSSATRGSADQTVPVTLSNRTSKRNGKSKLSREDLMKISQGSPADIDVYLQKNSVRKLSTDPP